MRPSKSDKRLWVRPFTRIAAKLKLQGLNVRNDQTSRKKGTCVEPDQPPRFAPFAYYLKGVVGLKRVYQAFNTAYNFCFQQFGF